MSRADLERRILEAVREELEHDAHDNAEFGKKVLGVQLVGEFPDTKLVVAVDERRPPLALRWSVGYDLWDGSWGRQEEPDPSPDSVATLVSADFMESSGAFINCFDAACLDDDELTHARLAVRDFDGCLKFYRDGLGFCSSVRSVHDNPHLAVLQIGNALLTVVAFDGDVTIKEPPRRMYNAAMFLRVRSVDESLGSLQPWAPLVGKRAMGVERYVRVVQVLDPDGNLIEITDEEPPGPSADGAPDSLAMT